MATVTPIAMRCGQVTCFMRHKGRWVWPQFAPITMRYRQVKNVMRYAHATVPLHLFTFVAAGISFGWEFTTHIAPQAVVQFAFFHYRSISWRTSVQTSDFRLQSQPAASA